MIRKALNRYRRGRSYTGVVVYSTDPLLVPWPGHYGVKDDGSVDKHCQLKHLGLDGDGNPCWERA